MNIGKDSALFFGVIACLLLTPGCATTGRSIGAGAGLGAFMGAGVGALADPSHQGGNRFRNILLGTAIGGVVGAGAGYAGDRIVNN